MDYETLTPEQIAPKKEPWHSRGKLSPHRPFGQRAKVNTLLAAGLIIVQFLLVYKFVMADVSYLDGTLFAQIIGFLPTAILICYIYKLDTIDKEPIGLIATVFFLTAAVTMIIVAPISALVKWLASPLLGLNNVISRLVENIICIALVEESIKYAVLLFCTWNNDHFNCRFDGVVYAVSAALGFAALENILYISDYGAGIALLRSLTAVPGHCIDGILMGIFYGQAKTFEKRGNWRGSSSFRILALVMPVLMHGFYDFFAFEEAAMFFLFGVLVVNAVMFVTVWRQAQKDEMFMRPREEVSYIITDEE